MINIAFNFEEIHQYIQGGVRRVIKKKLVPEYRNAYQQKWNDGAAVYDDLLHTETTVQYQ
jgi:hypothetical protein